MKEITYLHGKTNQDIPAERVLDNAPRDLKEAMVLGYDSEGELYCASSEADLGHLLLLLEYAKMHILTYGVEDEDQ